MYSLGTYYNLPEQYGTENMATSMASSPGIGMATTGLGAGPNPYAMMGGSFLVNYLAAKEAAYEKKKQQAMDLAKGYGNDQEQGLQALNNAWKSALLK